MCNHTVAMSEVEREITVPAGPDEVWEALTDDELRSQWLRDAGEPRDITDEQVDEDARSLRFRWARPGEEATEVRFTVEAVPAGTRVVVVESAPSRVAWGPLLGTLGARVPAFA